jgi:hypothetical protein
VSEDIFEPDLPEFWLDPIMELTRILSIYNKPCENSKTLIFGISIRFIHVNLGKNIRVTNFGTLKSWNRDYCFSAWSLWKSCETQSTVNVNVRYLLSHKETTYYNNSWYQKYSFSDVITIFSSRYHSFTLINSCLMFIINKYSVDSRIYYDVIELWL